MLEINNEEWRVVFVSWNHPMMFRSDGSLTIGACNDESKTIYVSEEIIDDPYLTKKVLCHEITHAAMFSYNITLSWEQEELLADLIATYGQEIIHITNLLFHRL